MKSGKILFVSIVGTATIVFSFIYKKNKLQKIKSKPTVDQYRNRLEEFCLFDIEEAKCEFESFLEIGFNPRDAFDLTIIKRIYV